MTERKVTAPTLVDKLREIGLPMASAYASGIRLAWTTDPAKAKAAAELGAVVTYHKSNDPRFCGWQVRTRADQQ